MGYWAVKRNYDDMYQVPSMNISLFIALNNSLNPHLDGQLSFRRTANPNLRASLPIDLYQIILLGNRHVCLRTTCRGSLRETEMAESQNC